MGESSTLYYSRVGENAMHGDLENEDNIHIATLLTRDVGVVTIRNATKTVRLNAARAKVR